MSLYYPLESEDTEMKTKKSVKGPNFLKKIKKIRADIIATDQIYCENKAEKLFSVGPFFNMKILNESVDYVMNALEACSTKYGAGSIRLEITSDSKNPCIRELYKLRFQISDDLILKNNSQFLKTWGEYVFKTFTKLTEMVSVATTIPIRENTPKITEEHEEGMYLVLTAERKYILSIWWQSGPRDLPPKYSHYYF